MDSCPGAFAFVIPAYVMSEPSIGKKTLDAAPKGPIAMTIKSLFSVRRATSLLIPFWSLTRAAIFTISAPASACLFDNLEQLCFAGRRLKVVKRDESPSFYYLWPP